MADALETPGGDQQVLPGVEPTVTEPKPAPKPAPAALDKKQIAALRKEWEAELHTKTGGKPIDEIIESHKASEAEKLAAAEAAKTELERITGRAEKAEKSHAAEIARARELESENRNHRLTDRVREIADGAQLRQPQYKKLLMTLLKERAQLTKDGSNVVYLDEKGQPDEALTGESVLEQVLAKYPDLTGTSAPGQGGGAGVTVPAGAGGSHSNPKKITQDEERRIYAGLLTHKN